MSIFFFLSSMLSCSGMVDNTLVLLLFLLSTGKLNVSRGRSVEEGVIGLEVTSHQASSTKYPSTQVQFAFRPADLLSR
jgi:hypothetical protein